MTEYKKAASDAMLYTCSSARMIDESEIDPAVLRKKQMECGGVGNKYIDMFCNRYRDRGIAHNLHTDAAKQEKREALNRAITPGAYVEADKLAGRDHIDAYRTGVCDGHRYMTADDFARYYHDQRGYKNPQYRVATDADRIAAVQPILAEKERETRLEQPKKALWLTESDKLYVFLRKTMGQGLFSKFIAHPAVVRVNEWAAATFPREGEVRDVIQKHRKPIPAGLVASFVTVIVSMAMVISSTVSVSQATREVSELKDDVHTMRQVEQDLEDLLSLKNDMLAIEDRARNELGMVNEKYLNGEYMKNESEDHLEVYDKDRDGENAYGWSWLLSAFGIKD